MYWMLDPLHGSLEMLDLMGGAKVMDGTPFMNWLTSLLQQRVSYKRWVQPLPAIALFYFWFPNKRRHSTDIITRCHPLDFRLPNFQICENYFFLFVNCSVIPSPSSADGIRDSHLPQTVLWSPHACLNPQIHTYKINKIKMFIFLVVCIRS